MPRPLPRPGHCRASWPKSSPEKSGKAHLTAQLKATSPKRRPATPKMPVAQIKANLRDELEYNLLEWGDLAQARAALQGLLTTRIVFTPVLENGEPTGAEFTAEGCISPIVSGVIASKALKSGS